MPDSHMAKHRTNSLDFDESMPGQHIPGQSPVLVLDRRQRIDLETLHGFYPRL